MFRKDVEKKVAKAAARAAAIEAKVSAKAAKQEQALAAQAAKKSGKSKNVSPRVKSPYRPRFAVAPRSVRVFTLTAFAIAFLNFTISVALLLYGVEILPYDVGIRPTAADLLTGICMVLALFWFVVALKVSQGSRFAWRLGLSLALLNLFSIVSVLALFALLRPSARAWAI